METDVLSDLLRCVRLRGAIYMHFEAAAPWRAETPRTVRSQGTPATDADHLIQFHAITRGECWVQRAGARPVLLSEGDVIVYLRGDPHVMASSPDLTSAYRLGLPRDLGCPEQARGRQFLLAIEAEPGRPAEVAFVCGFLSCDLRSFNPLISALPREIHLKREEAHTEDWLGTFLNVTKSESRQRRAGGQNMVARMSELMLVEVIRRHLEGLPAEQTGWLAGLRDRQIGKALALIHGETARAWTVAELGERVALSRSAFADRFAKLVGMSPMQYLAHWRMQLASELLIKSDHTLAAIAEQVGYESDTAFSRAFRRMTGVPPASWRRDRSSPAETFSVTQRAHAPGDSSSAMTS